MEELGAHYIVIVVSGDILWFYGVAVDSEQFFICLKAAQCKLADLNGHRLAITQEWTEFVKDETEI